MKPLIGITSYFVADEELRDRRVRGVRGQDMLMSNIDYSRSIHEQGGVPVALPVLSATDAAADVIQRLDGLLLAGGEDVAPALFRQNPQTGLGMVVEHRDRYEWALVEAALTEGTPILGICRGFQLLNVYFGGTLHQDLATCFNSEVPHHSAHLGREALVHDVQLREGTFLRQCYGTESIRVNSLHHQGLDILAPGLSIAAISSDGLVEGFQHSTFPRIWGVQWHPEMMTERHTIHRNLFRFFIEQTTEAIRKKPVTSEKSGKTL